jgi:hypothetical protein
MGISMGCQVLSSAVDYLFGDLKHKSVYNFVDGLVVYSGSFSECLGQLKGVFKSLKMAAFTLNRDKLHLTQWEIFLGHSVSAQGVKVLPERNEMTKIFPFPQNLKDLHRFLGMVGFYGHFIECFHKLWNHLMRLNMLESSGVRHTRWHLNGLEDP